MTLVKRFNDDILSAYLDGELPIQQCAELEQALAASPSLKTRLDSLRRANQEAVSSLREIDRQPLPASIEALLAKGKATSRAAATSHEPKSDNVVAFMPLHRKILSASSWAMPIAAAVVMAIGVASGYLGGVSMSQDRNLVAHNLGVIDADAPLYNVLETAPSGTDHHLGREALTASLVLTFQQQNGDYCRTFRLQGQGAASDNIACRSHAGEWQVVAMAAAQPVDPSGYQMASGGAAVIDSAIAAMIAGDALNGPAEVELIASGWAMTEPHP